MEALLIFNTTTILQTSAQSVFFLALWCIFLYLFFKLLFYLLFFSIHAFKYSFTLNQGKILEEMSISWL